MSFDKKQVKNIMNVLNSIRGPYSGQKIPDDSLSLVENITVGDLVVEFNFCIDEAAETLRGISIAKKRNAGLGFTQQSLKESKLISRLRKVVKECACEDENMSYHPDQNSLGGYSFEDSNEYEEAGMIKSNLGSIASKAQSLHDMIGDSDDLPEWVQEKIAVADEMIDTISDYLSYEYNETQGVNESKPQKGFLFQNINKRKKAGTSRSKKNSTIDDKTYKAMKKW